MSKIDFLSFILDSVLMRAHLTQEKADKVVSACQKLLKKTCVSIRDVPQTIGFLVPSSPAIQCGPVFYRSIEIDKNRPLANSRGNYEGMMTFSLESRDDFSPRPYKQIGINNPDPKTGWCAVCSGDSTKGLWSQSEKLRHINELKILVVDFGLRSFLPTIKGKHVNVQIDNSTTVSSISAMGGTRSPTCNKLAHSI